MKKYLKHINWKAVPYVAVFILACILGNLAIQKLNSKEIIKKNAVLIESMSSINNRISNLPKINKFDIGSSGNGTYLAKAYGSACNDLKSIKSVKVFSIKYRLIGGDLSRTYLENISDYNKANPIVAKDLCSIAADLKMAQKYLEYNPKEDFINLGQEIENDNQQIGQSREGIATFVSNFAKNKPNAKLVKLIKESQNQLEKFDKTRDITPFISSISVAQKEIINELNESFNKIVNNYNTAYTLVLYRK